MAIKATGAGPGSAALGVEASTTGAGASALRRQVLQFFSERLERWKEALCSSVAELHTPRAVEDSLVYVVAEKWGAVIGTRHEEGCEAAAWAMLSSSTPGQRKRLKEAGVTFWAPYLRQEKKRVIVSADEERELKALPGGRVIEDIATVGDGTVLSQLVVKGKENVELFVQFLHERVAGQQTRLPVIVTTFPFLHGTLSQVPIKTIGTVTRSRKASAQSETLFRIELQGLIHPACVYRFMNVLHRTQGHEYSASLATFLPSCRFNCPTSHGGDANRPQDDCAESSPSGDLSLSLECLRDRVVSHLRCTKAGGLCVACVTTRD